MPHPAFATPSAPLFHGATVRSNPPHRLHAPARAPPMHRMPRAVAGADASPSASTTPAQTPADFDRVVMRTYGRYPLAMSHGKGAALWDLDGRQYLDCVAGIATCTLGHADTRVTAAVTSQLERLCHVSNLYYIPEQGRLAEWLVHNSPMDKAFFCNSGGEANEAAIKLARKNWHLRNPGSTATPVIVTARQSFHGRTLATLTATGQEKYHANFGPLVPGFEYVTYNDVDDLRKLTARLGGNLAAILLEAVQGEGGIHPGDASFFAAARSACDDAGALLMLDEVQVGMGRTGRLWGFEHTGVRPDVLTTAKGLGGGVPIGAMLCTDACAVFGPGDHASTFGGNPLASAAGLAVGRALLEDGVLANVGARGAQLAAGLEGLRGRFGGVLKEVRGYGLILGVELVGVGAGDVVKKAMERGLLLVPAGASVVRFVPPLVITEAEVVEVLARFEEALADVVGK